MALGTKLEVAQVDVTKTADGGFTAHVSGVQSDSVQGFVSAMQTVGEALALALKVMVLP